MPLDKLQIKPDREGYSFTHGEVPKSIQLDGGAPFYRADLLGATTQIDVTWILKQNQYDYIMAFYRTAIKRGSLPFLIDLVFDTSTVSEYTVFIVPKTFKLTSQQGGVYTMAATLEVFTDPPTESEDNATISGYTP